MAQSSHTRSDDGPGALVSYSPAAQSVTAEHSRSVVVVGAADVYCPLGQLEEDVLHVRSDVNVGADDSYCVPSHVCTALHALPSFASEYVVPSVHAVHCRSAVAEGVLDAPCPVGQVAHAAQASVAFTLALALALYVPEAQVAHSRSPETVAATLVYVPAAQALDTATHASPESASEYVVPSSQAVHVRSDEADGATVCPWPAGQVAQSAQEPRPAEAVNLSLAQFAQVRSDEVVSSAVSYLAATHSALNGLHAVVEPASL